MPALASIATKISIQQYNKVSNTNPEKALLWISAANTVPKTLNQYVFDHFQSQTTAGFFLQLP